jgi:hypothetical protein
MSTYILSVKGNSQWRSVASPHQQYKKWLGEEGAKPKRFRYKPISR